MNRIKTILKFLLFLLVGLLFIWLSLKDLTKVQVNEILASFRMANYSWLILAFIISMFSHVIRAYRWRLLLQPLGYCPRIINVSAAVLIGYFANLALPRLGEVTRCGTLSKYEKISFTKSFGTVITERVFDIIIFFVLFFINLLLQFGKIHDYFYDKIYGPFISKYSNFNVADYLIKGSIILFIVLILLIIIFRKKIIHLNIFINIKNYVLNFLHGISTITRLKNPFLFIVYTILIWVGYWLSTYVCFFCFSSTSTFGLGAAFAVLVFGTIGVMITPGGIGAYTFIVAGVMINVYGVGRIDANAFGWLVWSAQTIIIIIAGTFCLITISLFNKKYVPQVPNIN